MVQTIDITRAKAIEGWMAEPELVWLAEQAVEHRTIVEVGSYLGRSTRAMLDHTNGLVYAYDDWKGPRDVYLSKEERAGLFQKFLKNVGYLWHEDDQIVVGENYKKLIVMTGDHNHCGAEKVRPDMIFIDGSHEYEDVKRDIQFWKPKLQPGGLLCGHDAGVFEGVTRAVMELLGDVEVADNTVIWYKVI